MPAIVALMECIEDVLRIVCLAIAVTLDKTRLAPWRRRWRRNGWRLGRIYDLRPRRDVVTSLVRALLDCDRSKHSGGRQEGKVDEARGPHGAKTRCH